MKVLTLFFAAGFFFLCSCGSGHYYGHATRADHIESFKNFDRKHKRASRVQKNRVRAEYASRR